MTTAQRRALLTLLGLIVTGHGTRVWLLAPGEAPGSVALLGPSEHRVLDQHRVAAADAGQPLRPGERLDLNTADAAALTRLPGVGDALARRIVADREAHGRFQVLADLDRVPGIGPALLKRVQDAVVQGEPATIAPGSPGGLAPTATGPLDLNRATEADLLRLPGIGPTKARAIMAYRQARGPFASVEDLGRVAGIGPATLAGLAGLVVVR